MNWAQRLTRPVAGFLAGRKQEVRQRHARKPQIGATICCANLRMTVQAGLSRELWMWLVAQGWREIRPGENRYRFRALPTNLVAQLFDAEPDRWERLLAAAIKQAVQQTKPPTVPARATEAVTLRD
ncbi:MAG: hypothetical protein OHK0044_32130 [Burkholderiaceae bacterium]